MESHSVVQHGPELEGLKILVANVLKVDSDGLFPGPGSRSGIIKREINLSSTFLQLFVRKGGKK